ncbi:Terpenoid synthase [Mycena sanguinolenta]|uniref:Terpenoid synthase n=1 Tax=Mycena sanguinolenta TaxID=230812 RepID=A0A8H6YYP8_9AGAR|nr:Terpenoid synthase [Mycena sanguinolenta]
MCAHSRVEANMQPDDALDLKAIVRSLLAAVAYTPSIGPEIIKGSMDELENAVMKEVRSWNVDDGQHGAVFASLAAKAASIVEFCYHNHTFEVKVSIALYSWFFFYIDDIASEQSLEDYQRRFLLGFPQEDPVLVHLNTTLGRMYNYWDPICANLIGCAALECLSGTLLENRPEISKMAVRPGAISWPKYLRTMSGVGPGYSCAIFPKQTHRDISAYIQILPDIGDYFCLANDVLSFYKEELAGETTNQVHLRADTTGKHPKRVLIEMVEEVRDLHIRITTTLEEQPEALAAWKTFEYGYMCVALLLGFSVSSFMIQKCVASVN